MIEDNMIIFDPLKDLKDLAEEIEKEENERGSEDGLHT